jgi:hypothetical protein
VTFNVLIFINSHLLDNLFVKESFTEFDENLSFSLITDTWSHTQTDGWMDGWMDGHGLHMRFSSFFISFTMHKK